VALGCEQLAGMADVIGEIIGMKQQPSGIRVGQMRVPIGVFGMIYESRPNVTIEAASLAIKSGNAAILRGGSEAIESNKALAELVSASLAEAGLPVDAVQLVQTTDREAVGQLIAMPQFVDVIIPRGGKGLIERISRDAKVPVIKHLDGNCHVYVDDTAEFDMALRIVDNAKTIGADVLGPGLEALAARHPMIGEVRGLGVFWALDLVDDQETRAPVSPAVIAALKTELMQRGLIPFSADNRIHVVPPCVITPDEVARALAIYDEAFTAVETAAG
jgi:hypothetical protein